MRVNHPLDKINRCVAQHAAQVDALNRAGKVGTDFSVGAWGAWDRVAAATAVTRDQGWGTIRVTVGQRFRDGGSLRALVSRVPSQAESKNCSGEGANGQYSRRRGGPCLRPVKRFVLDRFGARCTGLWPKKEARAKSQPRRAEPYK